jgi:antitoxin YefM
MDTVTATEARECLGELLARVADTHEPIVIADEQRSAVLVSEDDWNAMRETLHVLSSPEVRDSIVEGMATPVEECDDGCDFW